MEPVVLKPVFLVILNNGFNLNNCFNFSILQSDGDIECFIDKLQIWEISLTETAAPSFKNLPDR